MKIEEIKKIRNDFPILQEKVYNKPLVYLDNGATTQKPSRVIGKINELHSKKNSSIHRGVHYLSEQVTGEYENARQVTREFINAEFSQEIIFTSGATGAINLVAFSYGEKFVDEGDEIIVSAMEHHANIVPWQMLCDRRKAKLKVIPVNDQGELIIEEYKKLLSKNTKMVAVTHVSNVLGTINPVKEITRLAHDYGVPVLIDGAQAIQHQVVDVQDINCDFYVFSGHKVYGPTGIGVLFGKTHWLTEMGPYQGGGDMVDCVSFERTTYNELPFKFEAGTTNYIGAIGLAEALSYIREIGLDNIAAVEHDLLNYGNKKLLAIDGLRIIGEAKNKTSIFSFVLEDIHQYDAGMIMDKMGIAVRTGTHCAQPIMDRFGVEGTIRASFCFYNTREEIDLLVEAIQKVKQMFG